jgi:hypothetical protein
MAGELMNNIYLEKLAGLGAIGKTVGKVVGVLKGENVAKAGITQAKASTRLLGKMNIRSKRFQAYGDAHDNLAGAKDWHTSGRGHVDNLDSLQSAADATVRPYHSADKAYKKIKDIAAGKSVQAEKDRTIKYRMNAVGATGVGLMGAGALLNREKKAEMNNKYLEKVASITGIELAALGGLGGYAADKGDGNGGAIAGMAGGVLGHKLGHKAAPYGAVGYIRAEHALNKLRNIPMNHTETLMRGITAGKALRAAATVGGAYGAARAYSNFKHRND